MPIKVVILRDNQGLLYNKQDVETLRKEGRIVGTMIGQMRKKKMPCDEGTLPLLLSPEEITLALELGFIQCHTSSEIKGEIIESNVLFSGQSITIPLTNPDSKFGEFSWNHPSTPQDHFRYSVFRDLHSKGYYLTDGIKFGGDWLAYPGDPLLYHAQFVVRAIYSQEIMNPLLFVASAREAHAARKHLLLAYTTQDLVGIHYSNVELKYLTIAPHDGFGREESNKQEQSGHQDSLSS